MDDQLGITVEDVENKILKQRPDILFIDHVGLMNHGNYKNTWEGVANTSKRLKQLAMKHDIPIIGLVQETKDNGLKGSDNLTNDADGIFFMKSEPPKEFITRSEPISSMNLFALEWSTKVSPGKYLRNSRGRLSVANDFALTIQTHPFYA